MCVCVCGVGGCGCVCGVFRRQFVVSAPCTNCRRQFVQVTICGEVLQNCRRQFVQGQLFCGATTPLKFSYDNYSINLKLVRFYAVNDLTLQFTFISNFLIPSHFIARNIYLFVTRKQ